MFHTDTEQTGVMHNIFSVLELIWTNTISQRDTTLL